jgi:hypothetical protein
MLMDDSSFLVPVEVKYINDSIGHGLFTKADIPKGKLLWTPVLVKQYSIEECKQILRSKSKSDANRWLRQSFILMHDQNHLCVNETDVGRFMNHSSNPNTGAASSSEPSVSLRNNKKFDDERTELTTTNGQYPTSDIKKQASRKLGAHTCQSPSAGS